MCIGMLSVLKKDKTKYPSLPSFYLTVKLVSLDQSQVSIGSCSSAECQVSPAGASTPGPCGGSATCHTYTNELHLREEGSH